MNSNQKALQSIMEKAVAVNKLDHETLELNEAADQACAKARAASKAANQARHELQTELFSMGMAAMESGMGGAFPFPVVGAYAVTDKGLVPVDESGNPTGPALTPDEEKALFQGAVTVSDDVPGLDNPAGQLPVIPVPEAAQEKHMTLVQRRQAGL